jgi:hypothetical protein
MGWQGNSFGYKVIVKKTNLAKAPIKGQYKQMCNPKFY